MLAIIGASGKIGGATLDALLSYKLIPASNLVCLTSSKEGTAKWEELSAKGVQVRHATFDSAASLEAALHGCEQFLLVSSPRIELDFNDAPHGSGREKDHFAALEAAAKAGVKHVYYTSLAFGDPTLSGVMEAHLRTEAFLRQQWRGAYTVLREGLYNESWPLYLGHSDLKTDDRGEVLLAGDGPVCWTSIADLGLATAVVLSQPGADWAGKTVYLSNTGGVATLKDVAKLVTKIRGREVTIKIVSPEEHEKHYIDRGVPAAEVRWWAKTYPALEAGECLIKDTTLESLLKKYNKTPTPLEETIRQMLH